MLETHKTHVWGQQEVSGTTGSLESQRAEGVNFIPGLKARELGALRAGGDGHPGSSRKGQTEQIQLSFVFLFCSGPQ